MVTKNHKEVKIIFKQIEYYVPVKFWFLDQHFWSVLKIYVYLHLGSKQLTNIAVEH